MILCAEGALVLWSDVDRSTVGVITEVIGSGRQIRVRLDDGNEQIFALDSGVIERFLFRPGDAVQLMATGMTGVVTGARRVRERISYTVSLPGGVRNVSESGLRPANVTDTVERLRTGKIGNPRKFALRSTAARYAFANRYDEFTSLGNTRVEAKPHQISVARRVVDAYPHRFMLCDEVGLGKTIEAGLVLKELRARGVAKRVLILVPSNLLSQWQFELKTKFNESFAVYNRDSIRWLRQTSEENVWTLHDSVIASHSFAPRTQERIEEIASVDWDMVIVDEAHHARVQHGGSRRRTLLYNLVQRLADMGQGGRRSLLFLTATPMQLDRRELFSLVELVDPALFPTVEVFQEQVGLVPELNRLTAAVARYEEPQELARILAAGTTEASTGPREDPGYLHAELERRVTAMLGDAARREAVGGNPGAGEGGEHPAVLLGTPAGRARATEMLRSRHQLSEVLIRNRKSQVGGFQPRQAFRWPVEQTREEREAYAAVGAYVQQGYERARTTNDTSLGFVMTTFQKLMASSSNALRISLERRMSRLAGRAGTDEQADRGRPRGPIDEETNQEMPAGDLVEDATARERQPTDLEELLRLDLLIGRLRRIHLDSKARVLLEGLEDILAREPEAKILIFTEFRETQNMLADLLGERWPVHLFHGQLGVHEKDRAVVDFRDEPGPRILVSTEAGGEGRNLQFCHLLVNYDLPWNPMRVEQRIGRIDRIGQERVVMIFNFGVVGTIEERVLDVLERRIGMFEDTVGGLDPILGEVETDLGKIFRLAEEETQRTLERMMADIQRRVAEARRAEAQLADFIMDARSFRPELVRGVMDREQRVDYAAMETFVRALLKSQKTYIGPADGGVAELVFHEPFVSNFPQFVRDGGQQRLACFRPNVAREEEEVEFLAFGHPVVDELVDQVLDEGFEGIATVRHIRNSGLPPGTGYQFNYAIEVEGVRPRKMVFPVFVDEEGQTNRDMGEQLLGIEALFNDERGSDELAPAVPTNLDTAHEAAEDAAACEMERFTTELAAQNRENLRRERMKLERYFDYRAVAAADKVAHARRVVGRLRESESPSEQKILPVWERNLEIAVAVEEGLVADRGRQLSDLDRRAVPESNFRLLNVARIVVHPDDREGIS